MNCAYYRLPLPTIAAVIYIVPRCYVLFDSIDRRSRCGVSFISESEYSSIATPIGTSIVDDLQRSRLRRGPFQSTSSNIKYGWPFPESRGLFRGPLDWRNGHPCLTVFLLKMSDVFNASESFVITLLRHLNRILSQATLTVPLSSNALIEILSSTVITIETAFFGKIYVTVSLTKTVASSQSFRAILNRTDGIWNHQFLFHWIDGAFPQPFLRSWFYSQDVRI